jgi:short subunit dehydrogenase-like uncharacterized protein
MDKQYDLIIFGATGFTGRLVVEYLWKKYGLNYSLRWAIAARNKTKLDVINKKVTNGQLPMEIADSNDKESLNHLCRKAKTICTTIGPYSKYGTNLVAACIANQTDYCDLSGEVTWMRKIMDQFHDKAKVAEVKIVHSCGFDSIPSDMGVWKLQGEFKEKHGFYATQVETGVKAMKGGFSGGTFASLGEVMKTASEDKAMKRVLLDPHGLDPSNQKGLSEEKDLRTVQWSASFNSWVAPFIMSTINTRIVRRSHALSNFPYGKNFIYREFSLMGKGMSSWLKAWMMTLPLGIIMSAKPGSFIDRMIQKWAPSPGEGPSKEERENGFWVFDYKASNESGDVLAARIKGDKDPGYGSTSKMLGEAAVCLSLDPLPSNYGILTPATAMGEALWKRLDKNAGLSFKIKEL